MTPASPADGRWTLLASAVAGRPVGLAVGADEAYSDGQDIVLPEGLAEVRDTLVVQAALLAAGSLEPRVVARTAGRRRLRRRYLALEVQRAVALLGPVVPRTVAERVGQFADGPPTASAEASLERALSAREVSEAPAWCGTIRPGRVLLAGVQAGASAPTEDDQAGTSRGRPLDELDDEEESERSRIMELFSAPVLRNPFADLIQGLLGAGRAPSDDGSGGEDVPIGGNRIGPVGDQARAAAAAPSIELALEALQAPTGARHPEWDWQAGRYKPDWCTVVEYDPRLDPEAEPAPGRDRQVERQLARLGLAPQRHRRQQQGDVLDLTAVVDLAVDRAAGRQGDDRIYETKLRTAHDLGVVVLLDSTGSTGDSEDGQKVFDEQRRVAAHLLASLDELGDRVAGYAFQSYGRGAVRFLRIKGFDDRYDHAARRRLGTLAPSGFTRLGAAIRHGTSLVTERAGTVNQLVVVVGDGLPYDDGYEHRYAQEDSRRALEEAVSAGVGCACISVRTATEDDVLERVWGHVPYLRLERSEDLARHVLGLLRRGLKQADDVTRSSPLAAAGPLAAQAAPR
ncbi:nitric oxide reductase activation protein NorD [Conexibacter sp. SYSU D00693]|uniref:nitric oxide reductase activation protein NorD n=1 Tax=Conexibacter sp. SYSU D00693 TaxID=2812560 RepID=UPI00196B34FE|nr:VWA domain-containing protein [Conexibacter sp. SYSU D00693]